MTIAYLDTASGIAGDMMLAALVDAGADQEYLLSQLSSLGLPGLELEFAETERHCFRALQLTVKHPPEHAHRHLSDITKLIDESDLTSLERDLSLRLFGKLGAAEAKVHGTSIEEVHFHEVGAVDSIVDIIGIAIALNNLNVSRILAAPTPTGCGSIHIAHGVVSVPAPATAELLKGVPVRSSNVACELTTPTGAAVLATLCDGFGPLPDMQIHRIGYGAGHKNLKEQANLLRVFVGEELPTDSDEILVLETNLDDSTGEQIAFAVEQVWKVPGILDVFTTAIGMKKNRPAVLLSVLCQPESRARVEDCLFQHTSSLGVRCNRVARRKLLRDMIQVDTDYGVIRVKVAWSSALGVQRARFAPEYEDCRKRAEETGLELASIYRAAFDAAEEAGKRLPVPPLSSASVSSNSEWPQVNPGETASHSHHHDHGDGQHDHGTHDHGPE